MKLIGSGEDLECHSPKRFGNNQSGSKSGRSGRKQTQATCPFDLQPMSTNFFQLSMPFKATLKPRHGEQMHPSGNDNMLCRESYNP